MLINFCNIQCTITALFTFVVVLVVGAILLQRYTAVWAVPALVAAAFPLRLARHTTLAVVGASAEGEGERHDTINLCWTTATTANTGLGDNIGHRIVGGDGGDEMRESFN